MASERNRPGMPPAGHYEKLGRCYDRCDSYAEMALLRELVAYPRSGFAMAGWTGPIATRGDWVLHQQYPLSRFFLDFALTSTRTIAKLAIEVDGAAYHPAGEFRPEREATLAKFGWVVARIQASSLSRGGARDVVDGLIGQFQELNHRAATREAKQAEEFAGLLAQIPTMSAHGIRKLMRDNHIAWAKPEDGPWPTLAATLTPTENQRVIMDRIVAAVPMDVLAECKNADDADRDRVIAHADELIKALEDLS